MQGKVATITGSSRGIGKAIALGLAEKGVVVVVAARSETERPPTSCIAMAGYTVCWSKATP